jgi:hypothetical protein
MSGVTDRAIQAISRRERAATPSPWFVGVTAGRLVVEHGDQEIAALSGSDVRSNAEFIAHARQDISALLDTIREQAARIDAAHHTLTAIEGVDEDSTAGSLEAAAEHIAVRFKHLAASEAQTANEIERLRAENAAMLAVVRAAEEWRAQFSRPDGIKFPRRAALIAAVDALTNMQEPCDICSSTAGGCPECRNDSTAAPR